MFASTSYFAYTKFLLSTCFIGFSLVLGCGQLPQGEVTAMTFTASGFTVPAEMAYSEVGAVQTAIANISHSREAAVKVVSNLVINAVTDVLQEQGRNALLPDAVISLILQQLNVNIEYTPLNCPTATDKADNLGDVAKKDGCFIINNLVRGVCTMNGAGMCNLMDKIGNVMPTPIQHRTIKGSLRTSNSIMANWSRGMWQSILNRVYQKLMSSRFGEYFSSATVTVNN